MSRRLAGRFDAGQFSRELDHNKGKVAGHYNVSLRGFSPYHESSYPAYGDPSGRDASCPADQCRRRSPYAQAGLAAGRLLRAGERRDRAVLELLAN